MTLGGVLILFGFYLFLLLFWCVSALSAKGDRDDDLRFLLDRWNNEDDR